MPKVHPKSKNKGCRFKVVFVISLTHDRGPRFLTPVFVLQKILNRSLIVVEKDTGVEMKNVLVEPSTKCPVMLTSYETKKTHVGVLATSQEVAVACPIA